MDLEPLEESDYSQFALAAFKMLLRAVKFLDVWIQVTLHDQRPNSTRSPPFHARELNAPPTPPADLEYKEQPPEAHQGNRPRAEEQPNHFAELADTTPQDLSVQQIRQQSQGFIAQTSPSPSLPLCLQSAGLTSPIVQTRRQSVSHRFSWLTKPAILRNDKLASERLVTANEIFLSSLSIFLGVHLITESSTEILVNTQQSVNAGRSLLTVVEAVWDRDLLRSKRLEESRDFMYMKITELVHSAQEIFHPVDNSENSEFDPVRRRRLAEAAMSCIKGASDCVEATRNVIELLGDFEFETIHAPSAFSSVDFQSPSQFGLESGQDRTSTLMQQFPTPPASSKNEGPAPDSAPYSGAGHSTSEDSGHGAYHDLAVSPSNRTSIGSLLPPPPSLTASGSSMGDSSPVSPTSVPNVEGFQDNFLQSRNGCVVGSNTLSGSTLSGAADMSPSQWNISNLRSLDATPTKPLPPTPPTGNAVFDSPSTDQELEEVEARLECKTFAHELTFSKEGHITGGTLPALIERLTASDATPDAIFVSTFYLTFRLFSSPEEVANALIERFRYCNQDKLASGPVTLRVYNIFKGWLEYHWKHESDSNVLNLIVSFAATELSRSQPGATKRLLELARKVSETHEATSRRGSSTDNANPSQHGIALNTALPYPIITKGQLGLLRSWKNGGMSPTILDFEPLELARQLTVKTSNLFCSISSEELLETEWMKKTGSISHNVRAMSTLSNDIFNLVADTVLQFDEHSKRAKIIKQWVKIAGKCLELNNYDSLIAIICSLDSTPILRLKRTWDCISSKTKASLEQHKSIVACSKNYTTLRQRLSGLVPPCLPFVGMYLTDLTFVNAGNCNTRRLSSIGSEAPTTVINFDKHVKTARIIADLQRFQVPYRLQDVVELQAWLQEQFVRVRCSVDNGDSPVNRSYRRSCLLEPREPIMTRPGPTAIASATSQIPRLQRRDGEFMGISWR